MGIRFARRTRILPGLRLNLSKSGVSTSTGGGRAWLTFGKRGVRSTVGIPCTGLSYTSTSGTHPHGAPQVHPKQPTPPGSAVRGWVWLALIVAVCLVIALAGCAGTQQVGNDSDKAAVTPRVSPSRPPTPPANKRGDCARYYPPELRSAGIEGTTVLLVHVDETGNVREARVEGSSGNARLDEQAVACIVDQGWFVPPMKDGRPIDSWQRMKWTWKMAP